MVNKKRLVSGVFFAVIFIAAICLAVFYFRNQSLRNLSITEELSARFRAIDKNLVIQKGGSRMRWDNNDGYSIVASTSESIFMDKISDGQSSASDMIKDEIFKSELSIAKTAFAARGFVLNKNNSSTSTSDQEFFDYVQAYEKNDYFCTVEINADYGNRLSVNCTDKLAEAEAEEIPFLDALNYKNEGQVAALMNSEGEYFQIMIGGYRGGQTAILKKENGKYRVLLISQEAPHCSLIDKEKIPASVLSSIGDGDCYSDSGFYMRRSQSKSSQIVNTEAFSYSLRAVPASVTREEGVFDFKAEDLNNQAEGCGECYGIDYFNDLISKFNGATKIVYNFKYHGYSQTDLIFKVTLLPNKAGYTSLDQFKKDFDQCVIAGDAYPWLLNSKWLLFVNSCAAGASDDSGRPDGCGDVQSVIESSLELN